MNISALWSFPETVNEYAARVTAALVVALAVATIALDAGTAAEVSWLYAVIAVGFVLRVLAGPRFSPFGRLSVHVLVPLLGREKLVPGAPKRFAQGVGVVFSTTALGLSLAGLATAAQAVLGALVVAASLEAFAGFCLSCVAFGHLQRVGVIPESACPECADIAGRGGEDDRVDGVRAGVDVADVDADAGARAPGAADDPGVAIVDARNLARL